MKNSGPSQTSYHYDGLKPPTLLFKNIRQPSRHSHFFTQGIFRKIILSQFCRDSQSIFLLLVVVEIVDYRTPSNDGGLVSMGHAPYLLPVANLCLHDHHLTLLSRQLRAHVPEVFQHRFLAGHHVADVRPPARHTVGDDCRVIPRTTFRQRFRVLF